MLKTVLWIAAACVAVLVALAVSRGLHFDRPPAKSAEPPAPAAAVAPPAEPAAAVAPEAPPSQPPPPPPPEEQQIQDDAAATGMTTVEPDATPTPEQPPT